MPDFKVGDRVNRINHGFETEDMFAGHEYTVSVVNRGELKVKGNNHWYSQSNFELVKPVSKTVMLRRLAPTSVALGDKILDIHTDYGVHFTVEREVPSVKPLPVGPLSHIQVTEADNDDFLGEWIRSKGTENDCRWYPLGEQRRHFRGHLTNQGLQNHVLKWNY